MNARPLRLSTAQADFETLFQQRLHWSAEADAAIEQRVADILADVKARGDAAVLEYTERFDGLKAASTKGFFSPCAAPAALRSLAGVGTTMMISPTPATWAGMAFINTLDG